MNRDIVKIKEINVESPWFEFIKNKKKKVEGRLNKGIFKYFVTGDKVKIKNGENFINTEIIKINMYNTFKEYLSKEGLTQTLPDINTIKEGCDIYYKFYTKKQEIKYGILAIHIEII